MLVVALDEPTLRLRAIEGDQQRLEAAPRLMTQLPVARLTQVLEGLLAALEAVAVFVVLAGVGAVERLPAGDTGDLRPFAPVPHTPLFGQRGLSRVSRGRRAPSPVRARIDHKRIADSGPNAGMDPRIREHAEIIVEHSTGVQPGDNVVISAPSAAEDLAVALHELVGDRGASPVYLASDSRAQRAYLRAADADGLETPTHTQALYEASDVLIRVRAEHNATEESDVDPATQAAYSKSRKPVQEAALSKRWCLTQYPSSGNAQLAGMSTEAYENFVWDAVNKDWEAQRRHQARMVEILDPADEVRIKSGDTTDVRLSVDGMNTLNDNAEKNLPGGEVFTAPVADSVEGEVLFDMPLYHQGREITDAHLVFEDGEVVEHAAAENEDLLTEVLNTDPGASRLGELGIGMNRDIDRFTYNMLFDEKMGDTVHMAIGRAYDACVGEDREANESAVHVDMIVDMSEDSVIEVDGETVQRNGTFRFEDGFEA